MSSKPTSPADAAPPHEPVLVARCLDELGLGAPLDPAGDPAQGWWIDGTFGAGGHSRAMLARGACVLGIDRDPTAAERSDLAGCFRFESGNFRDMETLAAAADAAPVGGVLLDLGVSSMQLDEGDRGFSFRHDGPLDMRMGDAPESAADVVNSYDHADIAAILYRYGEERHSRGIARAIVAGRPFRTTRELADVVAEAYPSGPRRDHPARRTFQALRIYVNDELGALEDGLEAAQRLLRPGGRLVVLSYHSLEDRIVKHFLRRANRLEPRQKRPLEADPDEIERNPRARSAKLRSATKVAA